MGDLYRIYLTAKRDGFDFNLAYIPDTFNVPHKEDFDPNYMQPLFNTGYELARKGFPWEKTPPGYSAGESAAPPSAPLADIGNRRAVRARR